MTDEGIPDQQAVVRDMRFVTDAFYNLCQARGLTQGSVDGFFSLSGLLSKYVSVYEQAVARGEDVLYDAPVRAGGQHIEYIAEKFGRAFGPLIGLPATLQMFINKLRAHAVVPEPRQGRTQWVAAGVAAGGPPSDHVISSIRMAPKGAHELVRIWNRGGLSGELIVREGDGARIAAMLGLDEKP
jgi:hypothetical protein